MQILIGHGIDYHPLRQVAGLVTLAGAQFFANYTIEAHSDGDVLYHALADAILGALGLGDIGRYWSDKNPNIAGLDSRIMVEAVLTKMWERGYKINNLDVTLISDHLYLEPAIREVMLQNLKQLCDCQAVNLKATRHEDTTFYRVDGDVVLLLTKELADDAN